MGRYLKFNSAAYFGGKTNDSIVKDLQENKPNIVIGCPGKIMDLVKFGKLDLSNLKFFVVDECDYILQNADMRSDIF